MSNVELVRYSTCLLYVRWGTAYARYFARSKQIEIISMNEVFGISLRRSEIIVFYLFTTSAMSVHRRQIKLLRI